MLALSGEACVLIPGKFPAGPPGVAGVGIPEDGPSPPPPGLLPGNDWLDPSVLGPGSDIIGLEDTSLDVSVLTGVCSDLIIVLRPLF